jgi:hypothetical protein
VPCLLVCPRQARSIDIVVVEVSTPSALKKFSVQSEHDERRHTFLRTLSGLVSRLPAAVHALLGVAPGSSASHTRFASTNALVTIHLVGCSLPTVQDLDLSNLQMTSVEFEFDL